MLCREIIDLIESVYPVSYALDWDNVGLLAGRDDKEIRCIYIALDAVDEAVCDAVRHHADMLLTHHPLIFGGMKRITNGDFIGRRLLELMRRDISYYAMHTNYDVAAMGKLSAGRMGLKEQEVLEVTWRDTKDSGGGERILEEGIGRIGRLAAPVTLKECCEDVKRAFGLEGVRVFGDLESAVERAAICPGSGKSVIGEALRKHADVLITGDIGHHEGIDAAAQGMAVIDAGHYGIEHIFVEDMKKYLTKRLADRDVKVIAAPVCHPYAVI